MVDAKASNDKKSFCHLTVSNSDFSNEGNNSGALINLSTKDVYKVEDPDLPQLGARAELLPVSNAGIYKDGPFSSKYKGQNILILSLTLKDKDGNRSPLLKGKDQFQKILHHFEGQFVGIEAAWGELHGDMLNDNFTAYKQFRDLGYSEEESAFKLGLENKLMLLGIQLLKFFMRKMI